jgi:RNA polymerase sigma factor (sigma-70 family)
MDCQELLRSNLALVERLVRFVCHRARVVGADVDDFASTVKLALIENDYAVLRAWEGRSSLATYLTIIIQRLLADERIRDLGRWRPSAEAKRLGEAAILLEMLIRRDERTLSEAIPMVRALDDTLTDSDIQAMAARLPQRAPRARLVEIKAIETDDIAGGEAADSGAIEGELRQISERTSDVVRRVILALSIKDRMLLRLRFVSERSIAETARILQLPQRPLYRRLEQIQQLLREALGASGVDAGSAEDLIGSAVAALDFGLEDAENAPFAPDQHREGPEQRGGLS